MYRLTSEQASLVDAARRLADAYLAPDAARVDLEAIFPTNAVGALAAQRFLGLTIPPEYGGLGQPMRVACAVLDQLAQRCA